MGSFACSCIHHIAAAIQVILAIVIVVIVAVKLDNVSITVDGTKLNYSSTCALGDSYNSQSLCTYVYWVIAISMLVSLVISLVQCITCNLCGLGKILDLLFAAVGTVWWVIAAAVVQTNVNDAAGRLAGDNLQKYRDATVIMMWVEVGLFGLMVISGIFRVCSCIPCGGGDSKV